MSVINLNRVVLTGQISGGLELETLPSGLPVYTFELEVHRRRQDPETGAWGVRAVHVDIAVFGTYAEKTARYLYGGRPVAVDGWLDARTATGDGHVARHMRVVADTVQFLGAPREDPVEQTDQPAAPALSLVAS